MRASAGSLRRGDYFLSCGGNPPLLFTENDTNSERIFGTQN
jgi:hypothetical protein